MKNANTLSAMAKTYNEELVARMTAQAIADLEEKIFPEMEAAAKQGLYGIKYHLICGVGVDIIIDELTKNGYTVRRNGLWLNIDWPMF